VFELEALEPRVLLSGDGAVGGVTIDPVVNSQTAIEITSTGDTTQNSAVAYDPASQANGIFDGVDGEKPVPASSSGTPTQQDQSSSANSSSEAQTNQAATSPETFRGSATVPSATDAPANTGIDYSNSATQELTQTLNGANGPPLEVAVSQVNEIVFANTAPSQGSLFLFTGTPNADQILLKRGPSPGQLTIESLNDTFDPVTFAAPVGILRIEAGDGDDTITIGDLGDDFRAGLDGSGHPLLQVDGGQGSDRIVVGRNNDVVIQADLLRVGTTDPEVISIEGIERASVAATSLNASAFAGTVIFLKVTGEPVWQELGPGGLLLASGGLVPSDAPSSSESLPGDSFDSEGPGETVGGQVEGIIGGPVAGAVTAIAVSPLNPNIIYIGTTNGGVWRTLDATRTQVVDLNEIRDPLMEAAPDVLGAKTKATDAGAGVLPLGTYQYRITFVQGDTLVESAASASIGVTVAASRQIKLENIPLGPAGTSVRKIYRKGPGGGPFKLVDTLTNNSSTTYTDNKGDAALGSSRTKAILYPHWEPLTDDWDSLSISSLVIDPSDNSIYAGTGVTSSSREGGQSIGLLKSNLTNDRLWEIKGFGPGGVSGGRIVSIVPTQSHIGGVLKHVLWVATDRGSEEGENREGLFRSFDGGDTWTHIGAPGRAPSAPAAPNVTATTATAGTAADGGLAQGDYTYAITFVDASGVESKRSTESFEKSIGRM